MPRIRKFIKKPSNWHVVGIVLVTCLAMVIGMAAAVLAAGPEYDIRGAGPVLITTAEGTAIFEEYTLEGSTGTGTFHPFLQVNKIGGHAQSPVYGYSTNITPLNTFCEGATSKLPGDPGTTGVFYTTEPTYQPTLDELPRVTSNLSGSETRYVEFMLDSNQNKGGDGNLLTWDQLKIYQTNLVAVNYGDLGNSTTCPLVWDLDSAVNSWILFDAQFGSGSGQGDMKILIPLSCFNETSYKYVIAWVSFGGEPYDELNPCDDDKNVPSEHPNNDGFEEFGYVEKPRGCLEITKVIDWDGLVGDHADVPDVDFVVTVTGPSYPTGNNLTFHLVDGLLEYDETDVVGDNATACLCGLLPGDYYVTEPVVPEGWGTPVITGDDPATVEPDDACGDTAVEVIVTNIPPSADVGVQKTGNITYTIIVRNDGPSPALNVDVNDPLPGNLSWNISSSSGFTIGPAIVSGNLTGTIASLASGESAWVIVEAEIDGYSETPLLRNYVAVTTITLESNIDNNDDYADIGQKP